VSTDTSATAHLHPQYQLRSAWRSLPKPKVRAGAVAIIGDGAMTAGGMVFEAMNNAGVYDDINLLVGL
jgi:1-deoxy-D-xylulose-5-phosphate synthase